MRAQVTITHRISAFELGICSVVLWVFWSAWLNGAQPGDNIEQLLWSREWALGYEKHPPMSTWLLISLQKLFGRFPYSTYVLAGMCHVITLICMYRIARELLDPASSLWLVLVLSMTYAMTRKAQFFNHNTVLLMGLSLTTWLTLIALKQNRVQDWFWLGISLGGLLLTKYQALLGVALLYLILFRHSEKRHWTGWGVCTLVMGLVLLPHFAWLLSQQSGDTPLSYALSHAQLKPGIEGLKGLASYALGLIKQYALPILYLVGVVVWRMWQKPKSLFQTPSPLTSFSTSVVKHMTIVRTIFMVVIGLVGVRLQDHWAMPLAMFVSLPLARFIRCRLGEVTTGHLQWWIIAQFFALGLFTLQHQGYLQDRNLNHIERHLSSPDLVTKVADQWRARTDCSLVAVEGTPELTALLVAYSPVPIWRADSDPITPSRNQLSRIESSTGGVHLEFIDRASSQDRIFDETLNVSAYAPLKGLPELAVRVGFIYPQNPCPR